MNVLEYLNISIDEVSSEKTTISMPVRDEIKQPFGIVHGGINTLLAETAASLGANADLDTNATVAVGVDVQTHHIKAVTKGTLQATATPIHAGRQIQTWYVEIHELTSGKLTSASTVTLMIQSVQH